MCLTNQVLWLFVIILLGIVYYDLSRFNAQLIASLMRYWPEARGGFFNVSTVFIIPALVPFKMFYTYKFSRLKTLIPLMNPIMGDFEIRKKLWFMDFVHLKFQPQLRDNFTLKDFDQLFITKNNLLGYTEWFDDELKNQLIRFEEFNPQIIIKDQQLIIKARQIGKRDAIGIDEYVDLVATVLRKMHLTK